MRSVQGIILAVFLMAMVSCGGGVRPSSHDAVGDTVTFKYSGLLQVVRYARYTVVSVADPWHKGKFLHRYVLVAGDAGPADSLPEGTVVRVPLSRAIPFSTVHAALMMELGREDAIAGIADLQYVKIPEIQEWCRAGRIVDIGSSMSPNIEKMVGVSPDGLLVSPFENSGGYGKLEALGVPIIECADYMETSPLGRAEWMRFYGMLFGAERTADSLFAVVDSSYQALRSKAAESPSRPSVVMDKKTGSVWYVPGGRSTIGTMISDAGMSYAFSGNDDSGSLSLPFETVLAKAGDAAVWLFRYGGAAPATYSGLLSEYHGYGELRAFRERKCYGCNVEQSRFYEESPFRPDYLLGDFIRIAHPDVKMPGGLRYLYPVADK